MAQTEVLPATTKPRVGRTGDPCVMVIFGFSGDLTRRKLIPALYNLASQQLLSREFAIIGVGRSAMSDDDARKKLTEGFKQFATGPIDAELWEWFVRRISYVSGNFDDPTTYDKLKDSLARVDQEHNSHGNYFFYFANGIFEPIWNRRYIDHVQISVAETVGVEKRGSYYDGAGALRDMVPNHIMQLITLTAMEPPISFEANAVRDEQAKILHAIQPFSAEDVLSKTVRGQYGEGTMDNQRVPAYRSEEGVPPDSRTETFVAMRLLIDNWRWAGVPFYLRTGKRLPGRSTHVVIQF